MHHNDTIYIVSRTKYLKYTVHTVSLKRIIEKNVFTKAKT